MGPQGGGDERRKAADVGVVGSLKTLTKVKETVPQGHIRRLDTPLRAKGTVADIILVSFWDHFGIILVSFWDHFGIVLGFFCIIMILVMLMIMIQGGGPLL